MLWAQVSGGPNEIAGSLDKSKILINNDLIMCVCVYMCIYVYMCVYMCECVCMYMCMYMCVCLCVYVYVCICVCVCLSVCMCVSLYVYVCLCVCICLSVCICVSLHVHVPYVCEYLQSRQRTQDPLSWSYKWWATQHECWEPNRVFWRSNSTLNRWASSPAPKFNFNLAYKPCLVMVF